MKESDELFSNASFNGSFHPLLMHPLILSGDDGADGEEKLPSCGDYVMHFLTIFWKILFAFIPPTDYLGGWACFTSAILVIAGLTAIITDLASHFGCTINLKDSVTAISFVALGTSVPGKIITFNS